jgi:hypothetical protein
MSAWWWLLLCLYLFPGAVWTVHMLRHADEIGLSPWRRAASVPVLLFLWPVIGVWVGVAVARQIPGRVVEEILERDRT